jgi:integrase
MPKHKFSDRWLSALKPTGERVDYWDTLTPGFGVRVGEAGRRAFMVMTRVDGRLRRFTLKPPYPQLSLADARKQAEKIVKDAQVGLDPAAAKLAERKAAQAFRRNTFGAVAADFMQDFAKNHRTRDEMQRKIDVELLPHWRDRPIASITRSDVKALLREKARDGGYAANRLLALVSKIFTWALDEEIIQSSPTVRLPRLIKEEERERVLSADEIRILWGAFTDLGYPFGDLYKMMLLTGQRRGEVASMKWSQINDEGWSLPAAKAKTAAGHLVPLSSLAREVLSKLPTLGEHAFIARKDAPLQGWSKSKARLDRLARIDPWQVEDMRRTAATHMRSIGIDRLVVSKILNHAESGITKVYDRFSADPEKATALERWANRIKTIIGGKPEQNVVELARLPA